MARRAARRPRQDPAKARALRFWGGLVAGGAFIAVLALQANLEKESPLLLAGIGLVGFFVLLWGLGLRDRARRHEAPLAEEVLARDRRRPVLYLRSFEDDRFGFVEEEALASILQEVGPVVAIGRPGEALPPLGAARLYVSDEEWQRRVGGLMRRARLVLLRAGETDGLFWEVRHARERVDPKHLVLLVPGSRRDYERFRARVRDAGLDLPAHPDGGRTRKKAGVLRGLVLFDADWRASFHPFERAAFRGGAWSEDKTGPRLRLALRPIFERLRIPYRAPGRDWLRMGCFVYLVLAVLFTIALGIWLASTGRL